MEPWQSWAIVALGGGAAYYYYASQQKPKPKANRASSATDKTDARPARLREENSVKRKRIDGANPVSGSDSAGEAVSSNAAAPDDQHQRVQPTKKGKGVKQSAAAFLKDATGNVHSGYNADEESNRQFALRMAGVKQGTNLSAPAKKGNSQRSVKQSAANNSGTHLSAMGAGTNEPRNISATSSSTGADADDDLSPHLSPALPAAASESRVSGADVSDMLEAPAKGPSVLRITEASKPVSGQRTQQKKQLQPEETKKQRQNRKRAEEQKAARAEAEAQRRVLLEKQRRTAREAEGRPAKNGMGASYIPTQSPWADPKGSMGTDHMKNGQDGLKMTDAPLLDTFVPEDISSQSSGADARRSRDNGGSSSSNGTRPSQIWDRDLPSEEEQMRIINEMGDESGWSTVPKGRKIKKRQSVVDSNGTGADGAETDGRTAKVPSPDQTNNGPLHMGSRPAGMADVSFPALPNTGASTEQLGRTFKHPGDSDWAVL